jgi:hypothetical protein
MPTITWSPARRSIAHGMLSLCAFSFVLLPPKARAEEFCALTLNVVGSDGLPIRRTWVQLLDESGAGPYTMMEGSTLRICDFGFGPHTLRVGTNECLPVTISNLRVVIGYPVHLNVILNSCGYRDIRRTACFLYLRVVDTEGSGVPGADLLLRPIPEVQLEAKTDSYGRYQGLFWGSRDVIVTKEGFEPGRAHVQCNGTEELDIKVTKEKQKLHEGRQ